MDKVLQQDSGTSGVAKVPLEVDFPSTSPGATESSLLHRGVLGLAAYTGLPKHEAQQACQDWGAADQVERRPRTPQASCPHWERGKQKGFGD